MLLAATGAGAVVGGLRLAATADRAERWRVLLLSGIALAAGLAGVGLAQSYPVTLLCFVVTGWGTVTFNASSNTLIQTIVPDRLRGRMMSLYTLVAARPHAGRRAADGRARGALGSAGRSRSAACVYGAIIVAAFALCRPLRRL